MLPKVATHILHSTTRAVTSIQHQSYTIRNVLNQSSSTSASNTGLAPWNTPGNSNRGNNNGPGPGSAKYGAGSRYNGYTGAGRAVTQANATISSNDGSFVQSDDQDDVPARPPVRPTRIRSNSLSIPSHGRSERAEKLGVLKTVQLHARSRHAFAPQQQQSPSAPIEPAPRPRRNSTSATAPPIESFDPTIPAPLPANPRPSPTPSPAPAPSLVDPVSPEASKPLAKEKKQISHFAKLLYDALNSGDSTRAAQAVRKFRQQVVNPSVREFNIAIEALQATRRPGEPLTLILETYNDMLRHSLLPNGSTYIALIDTLTARDHEVHTSITAIDQRIKHRALTGSTQIPSTDDTDRKRIEMLRRENNFPTAMNLFEALLSIGGNKQITAHTYASLLRSCANHSNIDAAIHVFAQLEQRDQIIPSVAIFTEMIRVYTNAGQLEGAEQIFTEYRTALKSGGVYIDWPKDGTPSRENLLVWNQMIETYFRCNRPDLAVTLVEQMMHVKPNDGEPILDPPPISSSTFTTVIAGFCQSADIETALVWFNRLLAEEASSPDPFEPTGGAMQPDRVAWEIMIDALAVKGMIDDMNRLFSIRLKTRNTRQVRNPERTVVYTANMANLGSMDDQKCLSILDYLLNDVLNSPEFKLTHRLSFTAEITAAYLDRKAYDQAITLLSSYIKDLNKVMTSSTVPGHLGFPPPIEEIQALQHQFTDKLYQMSQGNVPYSITMELMRIAGTLRITQSPSSIPFFLQSYALSRASENLPISAMTLRDWELIVMAANSFESVHNLENPVPDFAYQGLPSLIRDLAKYNVSLQSINVTLVRHVILQLTQRLGTDGMKTLLEETGFTGVLGDPEQYASTLSQAIEDSASVSETSGSDSGYASEIPLTIDDSTLASSIVQQLMQSRGGKSIADVQAAFAKFKQGVEVGRVPHFGTISLLLATLGRAGCALEMNYAYGVAQHLLQSLEHDKEVQTAGWFDVENAMIIGLAHYGDVEGAHFYRRRILANGGAPDADAYGALIFHVKDTTDDASAAFELFRESQTYRITPNAYLYNNIISKLAKARKADHAVELFQQMKAQNLVPTGVTFGAVIGACARVGDVQSAELLFIEMGQTKKFRPRIPPYNTMMQMYTTTKPDRSRVLHFYEEMRKVGITPTSHTYKLLLDAYGSVEPVDLEGMNSVWEKLEADSLVSIQGTHYASLLNAYGCVSKDLDKAVEVFNEMVIPREAVVYEAMFNVLVVHRRADLITVYLNKMHLEGVHMTAYVANSLIKGYSILDEIEEARKVFESLEDPPQGVAAPNNHAPHSPSEALPVIDQNTPVYREPSTWEAMIRAELGSGNRDGAIALLERLKARQYPEAVFNRISGILVDHSQVPL